MSKITDKDNYNCVPVFPTPLIYKDLDKNFTKKLKETILKNFHSICKSTHTYFNNYHLKDYRDLTPVIQYCKGNELVFQSRDDLSLNPDFKFVCEAITECFKHYCSFCNIDVSGIVIHSMWYNIYKDKGLNPRHCHPNSLVSGVFIVQDVIAETHPESVALKFYHPNNAVSVLQPKYKDYGVSDHNFYINSFAINALPGTLLMWPSFLEHSVSNSFYKGEDYVETNDNIRISLAYNIMLKGEAGMFGTYYHF